MLGTVYIFTLSWHDVIIMEAWEKYKSVFRKKLFNKPERIIVDEASNVGQSCFINNLIKKYAYKFEDIIISGTFNVILFIKQRCYKNLCDTEFCPNEFI